MPVQPKLQRPAAPRTPALTPLGDHAGKPPILLNKELTTVGSRHDARLHLLSRTVSKAHALIVISDGGAYLRDLASRSHVFVNGNKIREVELEDGDQLQIGSFKFRYSSGVEKRRPVSPNHTPMAHLEVTGADLPVPITDRVVLIGRRPTCDVALVENSVSTAHAAIVEIDGKRYLRDLGSRTGTFLNGKRIRHVELSFGDQIKVGETDMRYTPAELSIGGLEESTGTASLLPDSDEPLPVPGVWDDNEKADDSQQAANTPASAEIADAPQQLLVDANLRQEKLSSSATYTELQAEADEAIKAAGRSEQEAADFLAVDDASTGIASRETDDLPEIDAELEPRRGWRSKRPAEPVAPQPKDTERAEVEPEVAEPEEPVAPVATPAPEATIESAAEDNVAEDEVFRLPNEDELNEEGGGTAVLDVDAHAEADVELTPFGETVSGDDALSDDADSLQSSLGLSPNLAELAAQAPAAPEQPTPVRELENIDFSAVKFDSEQPSSATDEAPAFDLAEPEPEQGGVADKPLIDLAPAARAADEVETTPELVQPLIARDAIPAAPETPAETVSPLDEDPASRRRPQRRKKKVDATVVDTPPAPPQPVVEKPVVEKPAAGKPAIERPAARPVAEKPAPTKPVIQRPVVDLPPIEPPVARGPAIGPDIAPIAEQPEVPPPQILPDLPQVPEAAPVEENIPELDLSDREAGSVEVLDKTEPTPESALDLAGAEMEAELEAQALATPAAEPDLTDTTFGRTVEDFAGESGPIVEEPPPASLELPEEAAAEPLAPPIEEETLPAEQFTAPETQVAPTARAPRPAVPPVPNFGGADQAGFLGGSPLSLGNVTPPPRPVRKAAPFGRKPVVPSAEAGDAQGNIPPSKHARGPFDVSPDDVPAADEQHEIPPFNGDSATEGQVTTAFDGLAMPPVRQTDVFSQMFPSADDEAILNRKSVDLVVPETPTPRAPRKSPGSALDVPADDFWSEDAEAKTEPAAEATEELPPAAPAPRTRRPPQMAAVPAAQVAEAPPRKRKRWWSIRMLLVLMLISMMAAAAGIYFLVPVNTTLVGVLKFTNADQLEVYSLKELQQRQLDLLHDPALRSLAQNLFKTNHPQARDMGFLNDPGRFAAVASSAKWDEAIDAMVVKYDSSANNPADDRNRVLSVLKAMYTSKVNSDLIEARQRLEEQVDKTNRSLASDKTEIANLDAEIERLKPLFENRPNAQEITRLQEELKKREAVWNAEIANVAHLKMELIAMDPEAAAAAMKPANPTTNPTTRPSPEADEQIVALRKSLAEANAKLTEQKKLDAEKAQAARKELDAALEQFQQQIAAAQGTLQSNPELEAFLNDAQALQQATKELTTELIGRQEEQHTRLTELKQRLDEKMRERRTEAWKNDPQLREYEERLEMTRRANNAAVANNLAEEAADRAAEVKLLEEMVQSRQALIGDDSFYADAIKQLEELIQSTEKQLVDDRKTSEERLARLQASFAKNQASKLPAEQQALAADLEKRIAEMNEARKQYATALGESTGGVDSQQLDAVITDLQGKIDMRVAEIEGAETQTADRTAFAARSIEIEAKRAQLVTAQVAEAAAQGECVEIRNQIEDLKAGVARARMAGDKLDESIRRRDTLRDQQDKQTPFLESRMKELERAAAPIAPDSSSISIEDSSDPRGVVAAVSVGGIALLFTFLIFLASVSPVDVPMAVAVPAPAEETESHSSNGHANGDPAEHAAKPAERHAEIARA